MVVFVFIYSIDIAGNSRSILDHCMNEMCNSTSRNWQRGVCDPRWMELLGSTAPIPANILAESVGAKTESHGLKT